VTKPLRVLIVEDSADDALLVVKELQRAGYEPAFEIVETPRAMNSALDGQKWDIIISDYRMPRFSGFGALELLNRKKLDIPFILVSGAIGEEMAVRAMKAGARDYIMKDNLARLVPAVERELLEARSRQERRLAHEEIKNLARFPSENPNPMMRAAGDGTLLYANKASAPLLKCWQCAVGRKLHKNIQREIETILMSGRLKEIEADCEGSVYSIVCAPVREAGYVNLYGRDITDRKLAEKELQNSFRQTQKTLTAVTLAMARTVEIRDPYTAGHQRRVAELACAIAGKMTFSDYEVRGIRTAALIHDIGKLSVPAEILSKPGRLTGTEFDMIKTHPQVGYEILKGIEFPWPVAQVVYQHHERMDGSGYPQGLAGSDIVMEARIIGVADVIEAMASHRPYRPALGIDKALEEISKKKGVAYDAHVAEAALKLFKENAFKFSK